MEKMEIKKITKAKKMKFIKEMLKTDEEFIYLSEKMGLTFAHLMIFDLSTKKTLQAGDRSLGDAEIFLTRDGYIEKHFFDLKMSRQLKAEYKKKFRD